MFGRGKGIEVRGERLEGETGKSRLIISRQEFFSLSLLFSFDLLGFS
jgi:hypothetical protein